MDLYYSLKKTTCLFEQFGYRDDSVDVFINLSEAPVCEIQDRQQWEKLLRLNYCSSPLGSYLSWRPHSFPKVGDMWLLPWKPSKKLMKWKPFKRLKEPGCFQHSRHVFFQRIDRNFIFATLPRCWTVPHSTQSSRRRSYHERGMLYCQCWNSNTHGWAMTFQHICCKIWGFTDYTFHIKRSLCKKNHQSSKFMSHGEVKKKPILIHPLGTATENRVHMCDQQRNCWIPSVMFTVGSIFFQWIIVIVVP